MGAPMALAGRAIGVPSTITTFVNLLAVVEQIPGVLRQDLLEAIVVTADVGGATDGASDDHEELPSFVL
ncbi:hypothetical protein [Polaromonas naphthalenivorans]|uniref:hypothetical protein n=1 Tax=Polaromonas naphthalenivorans TaxID=216465 RepID=UPI000068068E|nr:hypothetical protein [Polaromonas naphthalenivorans]